MMTITHELPTEIDGCTHVEERRWDSDRARQIIRVEIRGGRIEDDEFRPVRASGYLTEWRWWTIGPDRWTDFGAFCGEFEQIPEEAAKPLFWRAHAAALAYMLAVELGQRPLPEPPGPETEES